MAYNPNIPAPTNRVQDDIAAMRGNFQHLAPLAQLAPAAGELQAVSALAPYVQALLDSRIVEMGSNINGTYVRWENGLQVCWHRVNLGAFSGTQNETRSFTWTYPATFSGLARVLASPSYPAGDIHHISRFLIGLIDTSPTDGASVKGYVRDLVGGPSTTPWASLIAIGRWK